jgi:hypothetical protein
MVTVKRTLQDALITQNAQEFGLKTGLKYAKVALEEKENYLPFGELSEFCVLIKNGKPIGNFFMARKGSRLYFIVLMGLYFGDRDREAWSNLVMPKLERFSKYTP